MISEDIRTVADQLDGHREADLPVSAAEVSLMVAVLRDLAGQAAALERAAVPAAIRGAIAYPANVIRLTDRLAGAAPGGAA